MYVGVEIGGTKLQVGLCNSRGQIKRLERRPVRRRLGRAGILQQLEETIPPLIAGVKAIGVGFGGPVDSARGRVVTSHQVAGWKGFELKEWLERRVQLPVVVENDTNCAALAEATVGSGRGKRVVFYSNIGTGIGGGLVVDGNLYNGRYGAMEIGHTKVLVDGRWRTVESVAAGLAIERGVSTVGEAARWYGAAIANAVTLLNPDIVVIGGGVALAGGKFFQPLRETVRRLVLDIFRDNFKIVPAGLGETVVVVGAARLASKIKSGR